LQATSLDKSKFIISTELASAQPDDRLDVGIEAEAEADAEVEVRALRIGADLHGMRLDRALANLVPEFSRNYLQQLIDLGAVVFNGQAVRKPSQKVRAGEAGEISLRPTPQSQAFLPEAMALDVVYEDSHLWVIHKPAGLVVHPAPGNWRGTLLNGLLARDPLSAQLPRAGIVHRLDKDTSGLMVVARSRVAMEALTRAIAQREVGRKYLALGHKPWTGPRSRQVETAIGRDPHYRLRMATVDLATQSGKTASTQLELLQAAEQGCWVRATLQTGRTHQIRVHMASVGHPLVADVLYGGAPAAGLTRQALHAYQLAFAHPVTGKPLVFHAELPPDLQQALALWGLRYNGVERL